jgi:hypothetical protein
LQTCIAIQDPIVPVTDVEIANNLVLSERAPDVAFYGADRAVIAGWRIHHNARQAPAPAESDPSFSQWVQPTADTVVPTVAFVSDNAESIDFLRPGGELPAGAGNNLPDYVGALPPEGDEPWDWDLTWAGLHERSEETE